MGEGDDDASRVGPLKVSLESQEEFHILTTHMPFQAANSVAIPTRKPIAEITLHAREAELTVSRTMHKRPPMIPPTPSCLAKS